MAPETASRMQATAALSGLVLRMDSAGIVLDAFSRLGAPDALRAAVSGKSLRALLDRDLASLVERAVQSAFSRPAIEVEAGVQVFALPRHETLVLLPSDDVSAVLLINSKHRVVAADSVALELLDYKRTELVGLHIYSIDTGEPVEIDTQLRDVMRARHAAFGERRLRRRDGSLVDVIVSGNLISTNDGEWFCLVARELAREQLAAQQAGAAHAARAGERQISAASGVANDFNNLLTTVQLSAYMLASTPQAAGKEEVDSILDAARRAKQLAAELLALSGRELRSDPSERTAQSNKPERAADGKGERVLVVDDEPAVRKLTARLLRQHGYVVLEANNGVEALQALESLAAYERTLPIDCIVTDVNMPRLTGPELVRLLRERVSGLSVVYMSGLTQAEQLGPGDLEQNCAFLQKPFDVAELAATVRAVLPRQTPAA